MKRPIYWSRRGLLLAACAVGPNYRAPATAPAVLKNAQAPAFVAQTPEATWWQQFDDRGARRSRCAARWPAIWICELRTTACRAARAVFVESKLDYAPHVQLQGAYSHSDEQQPGFGTQSLQHPKRQPGL